MNKTLFKQSFLANYKLMLIFMAVLAMYFSVMVTLFDPKAGDSLTQMLEAMPQIASMFSMNGLSRTLTEFLSNYLYGFLMVIFPMIFEIMVANRLIVRHVDRGSMSCLLAAPHTRGNVVITQMGVLLLQIFLMILFCTILGVVVSAMMFPGELDLKTFCLLNIGVFFLHFAIGGICFLSSCIFNETRTSLLIGAGIPIIFFLIQMIANVSESLDWMKYTTILTLFNTSDILALDNMMYFAMGALFLIGSILYGIGIVVFKKRDLPL